ncbi:MAG TPA: hypothetical protein VEB20_14975 [Azospirillaceae bacterium]|nr:hypothetical protein [Azospirillaceae bacterium]
MSAAAEPRNSADRPREVYLPGWQALLAALALSLAALLFVRGDLALRGGNLLVLLALAWAVPAAGYGLGTPGRRRYWMAWISGQPLSGRPVEIRLGLAWVATPLLCVALMADALAAPGPQFWAAVVTVLLSIPAMLWTNDALGSWMRRREGGDEEHTGVAVWLLAPMGALVASYGAAAFIVFSLVSP